MSIKNNKAVTAFVTKINKHNFLFLDTTYTYCYWLSHNQQQNNKQSRYVSDMTIEAAGFN